jgi:DNA polymerase III epsilon subunit-like protein
MIKVLLENWKKYVEEGYDVKGKSLEKIISELQQMSNSTFIYFDTETLGLSPKDDQITQLAYAIYKNGQETGLVEKVSFLTQETKERFTDGTSENAKWKEKNEKYSTMLKKKKEEREEKLNSGQISGEEAETVKRELQHLEKDIKMATDPRYVLQYTGYDESKATVTEEEMLKEFLFNVTNKNTNVILVAHNIGFDERAVNTRAEKYGLPKIIEGKNISTLLDTLKICKSVYVPALESLLKKLDDQIKAINQTDIKEENEIKALSQKIQQATSGYTPEQKKLLTLNILKNATLKTLQRSTEEIKEDEIKYSAKLGDIAKTFNIDPSKAHQAIEDVKMLVDIFKEMIKIMTLVDNYLKNSELVITELVSEVEEYQKQVKAMHPKQINRLLSRGGNKDKLFKKANLKRSKSAPPGFPGGG